MRNGKGIGLRLAEGCRGDLRLLKRKLGMGPVAIIALVIRGGRHLILILCISGALVSILAALEASLHGRGLREVGSCARGSGYLMLRRVKGLPVLG